MGRSGATDPELGRWEWFSGDELAVLLIALGDISPSHDPEFEQARQQLLAEVTAILKAMIGGRR